MRLALVAAVSVAVSSQSSPAETIPPDVLAALAAAPTVDTVQLPVGQTFYVPSNVLKIRNLTLTPGSRLALPTPAAYDGSYYVIAISRLSVQIPSPTEASALISYDLPLPINAGNSCGTRPDGGRGGVGHDNGYPGGPGNPGNDAAARKPYTVYVVVGSLNTSGPNPTSGRFINMTVRGANGDAGGGGCSGGRGGDGIDRGSFAGPGDSGVPGPGGRGGAAAPGQDGASVKFFVSPTLSNEVRFILVDQSPGKAGTAGEGGPCGPMGQAGSGSFWGGGGRGIPCNPPPQGPAGAVARDGSPGTTTITEGNYTAILPLRGGAAMKVPKAPKVRAPVPPPPPPPA